MDGSMQVTNRELCLLMRDSEFQFTDRKHQLKVLEDFVISTFNLEGRVASDEQRELQKKLATFFSHATDRYEKESRKFDRFLSKNSEFLDNVFSLPDSILEVLKEEPEKSTPEKKTASKRPKLGRKPVPFAEKSKRSQQYASARVRELHDPEAIVLAASQQPSPLGQLVKKTKSPSGQTATLALKAIKSPSSPAVKKKSPEDALAFILNNDLTKVRYCSLKQACDESNARIWPNYNLVLAAKANCRPQGINLQELCAEVPLQNLLNHTVARILHQNPVLSTVTEGRQQTDLICFFKYGLDGTGSFSTFQQRDEKGNVPDGSTLMVSQLVPLKIILEGDPSTIIYRNRLPNSPNSCRPIRLSYERETKDTIRTEVTKLQQQVEKLEPFVVSEDPPVKVSFHALLTMIDGKILQEVTNTPASSSCPICHKTYRQIAQPDGDFEPKEDNLRFGASILHFGLRAIEALLNIGYRQDVKKSRIRYSDEEIEKMDRREQEVKAQFREKLGLIVDQRRDGGAGNTTTGNVARRAFDNPAITSAILGVPERLVENLGTIWAVMACGYAIDLQRFQELCTETKTIYFSSVGWYAMPSTLHKILEHGCQIIAACPVPLGITNEEASEANNKVLRRFRLNHSRRTSWGDGVQDLFNRLMDVSDPVILEKSFSFLSRSSEKKPLSPKILSFLKSPEFAFVVREDEDDENDASLSEGPSFSN